MRLSFILENAIQQNLLDQPVFILNLEDNVGPGELTFGGYDSSKLEVDLTFVKLTVSAATFLLAD